MILAWEMPETITIFVVITRLVSILMKVKGLFGFANNISVPTTKIISLLISGGYVFIRLYL